MRIENNPFYILGVTPFDSVDSIIAAAEDKKFDDDENESVYEEARSVLLSPIKRLEAEIRYPMEFLGDETFDGRNLYDAVKQIKQGNTYADITLDRDVSNVIIDVEQLYYETIENMAYVIEHLDSSYTASLEEGPINETHIEMNWSRQISGFLECDRDSVVVAIGSLRDDVRVGINSMFKRFEEDEIVEIANDVAEYLINQAKDYGEIAEMFVSEYSVFVADSLSMKKDRILSMIETARNYTEISQLEELEEVVRDFDYVAQPIQLLLRERMQSKLQKESNEVATAIRELSLYYHNEKGFTSFSLRLLDLEMELFSELPDFYKQLEEDKDTLEQIQETDKKILADNLEYEKMQNDYIECKNHLDKFLKPVRGWTNSNAGTVREILPKMKSTVQKMEICLQKTCDNDGMTIREMCQILESVYVQFGDACGWGGLWGDAKFFYDGAMRYAAKDKDHNLMIEISNRIELARKGQNNCSTQSNASRSPSCSSNQLNDDHSVSGALIGGAIGAAFGGPVGAFVGGVIGRWLGKK